jgi:hypothetical protein
MKNLKTAVFLEDHYTWHVRKYIPHTDTCKCSAGDDQLGEKTAGGCERRSHEGILCLIGRCGKDRPPVLIRLFALSPAGTFIVLAICHFVEQQGHNLL